MAGGAAPVIARFDCTTMDSNVVWPYRHYHARMVNDNAAAKLCLQHIERFVKYAEEQVPCGAREALTVGYQPTSHILEEL